MICYTPDMELQTQDALIIYASAIFLVAVWVVAWILVWRYSAKRPPLPLVALFAISSGMAFVWFFVSIVMGLFFTPGDHRDASSDAFGWTFGFTGELVAGLVNLFPKYQYQNPDDLVANLLGLLGIIVPFFTLIGFFFLLSVLPARFVSAKGDTQQTPTPSTSKPNLP